MKDLIADMRPQTQGVIKNIFHKCAKGGKDMYGNTIITWIMDAYIAKLEREGFIKYQRIARGKYCVGITLTRKGIDACLMSKCTRDVRELSFIWQ